MLSIVRRKVEERRLLIKIAARVDDQRSSLAAKWASSFSGNQVMYSSCYSSWTDRRVSFFFLGYRGLNLEKEVGSPTQ